MARNNIFGSIIGKNAKIGRCVTIIDGNVVNEAKNVTIVDGRVVSADVGNNNLESRKFDEKKVEDVSTIETIIIHSSSIDVSVTASESSNHLEVHFHGEACIDGKAALYVQKVKNGLLIATEINGCCFNGNLKLDVTMPNQFSGLLSIETTSADITVEEEVKVSNLGVKSTSGDVTVSADFCQGLINTTSGDIDFCIDATHDITVAIGATSGDISAEFGNIKNLNISTSSSSGDVKNRHKASSNGYTAHARVFTSSGDIRIR